MLLKDKLDHIFKSFDPNFNSTGKYFLIKLAKDEKNIDYNNLLFIIDDKSVVKIFEFLEEIGTLYDLLIYLFGNPMRIVSSTEAQIDFFKAITVLKKIISSMKTDITDQSEEQKITFLQNKKMFWIMQKCCLKKRRVNWAIFQK